MDEPELGYPGDAECARRCRVSLCYFGGGGGGAGKLSFETHAERSKKRNSSAASWGVSA